MPMEAILFVVFVGLLVINVPIGVALGLSGIASLLLGDMATPPLVVAQRMFTAVDSFPFMAIPFFMIAGGFMETGGMSAPVDLPNRWRRFRRLGRNYRYCLGFFSPCPSNPAP